MSHKEKLIKIEVTGKEYQLLKFIRELKFGKAEIIVHAGQPQKVIIKEIEKFFDGNIKVDEIKNLG